MKVLLFLLTLSTTGFAEPWLATRFAQNCAGCHAPGRKNLEPVDRRCSLSCQGCHVNPNGGGLRSHYGKWNENRWLRSFFEDTIHKKAVAPFTKQQYADESREDIPPNGFPLVVQNLENSERYYEQEGNQDITVFNEADKTYVIPQKDPYRMMYASKIDGGGDIRIISYQPFTEGAESQSFLMSVDFALRYRPIYKNVHFVYEPRFLGSPIVGYDYDQLLGKERTRSLYVLLDDMPWNIFSMAGYYRPLFGNMSPDHTALREIMTNVALTESPRSQTLVYQAMSVGTAPNVPYANLHFIGKRKDFNGDDIGTSGYAVNLGLRGVTRGQSVTYSYWSSSDTESDTDMHSITGAIQLFRTTMTGEFLILERETDTELRKANVTTVETQTRIWRENYVTFSVASSNTSVDLRPGSALQIKTGVRSFIVPGVDLSVSYDINRYESDSGTSDDNRIVWQIHTYF